nr:hypothetical protein bcere0006_32070 [Bacillus wiedmannii]
MKACICCYRFENNIHQLNKNVILSNDLACLERIAFLFYKNIF